MPNNSSSPCLQTSHTRCKQIKICVRKIKFKFGLPYMLRSMDPAWTGLGGSPPDSHCCVLKVFCLFTLLLERRKWWRSFRLHSNLVQLATQAKTVTHVSDTPLETCSRACKDRAWLYVQNKYWTMWPLIASCFVCETFVSALWLHNYCKSKTEAT